MDAGYAAGNTVTPFYDPLLAKLCVHGADRAQALERARAAVAGFRISGLKTNLEFHADLLASAEFCQRRLRHVAGGPTAPVTARSGDDGAQPAGWRLTGRRGT